jgi:hypothetical protein
MVRERTLSVKRKKRVLRRASQGFFACRFYIMTPVTKRPRDVHDVHGSRRARCSGTQESVTPFRCET